MALLCILLIFLYNCTVEINECAEVECMNGGVCVDKLNSYECNCTNRWTGTTCEEGK